MPCEWWLLLVDNEKQLPFASKLMRAHNKDLKKDQKVAVCGLDLYSIGAPIRAVIKYLDHIDPKMGVVARKRYRAL
jgi:erythromycin esterase-like protein